MRGSVSSPTAPFAEPADGGASVVTTPCGPAHLEISATLTFQDSSRDGFWPLFSRPEPQHGRRALASRPFDGGVEVEALTELPRAVYSHLNTFAEVRVRGLRTPALRFSATGDIVVPSTVFDYPKGRPAHFAFRTAAGDFVVARGADAEKGPFTTLARGRLSSEEALTVTVLEGEQPLCDLTFLDFAAQADTSLSPTAGEGISVNVVQFGRPAKQPDVTVLHLSLAETGIGSGLDAVGHAPGVYVNRLRTVSR
ncbi:MAG: hypothetical protein AB1938_32420 [Myxococcota bacterium]